MEQEKNLLPLIKVLKDKQEINFKALPKTQVKNSITLYGFLNSQKIFEINLKHIKSIEMAYCI